MIAPATTELVFIGKSEAVADQLIAAIFNEAHQAATSDSDGPHIVTDLRAFSVLFG